MPESFDLIILGGGRAANLATAAANAGLKTALIEQDKLGGTCPNRGCVPSKLLIGFAEAARHVQEAGRHFIDAELHGADLNRAFASVNEWAGGVDGRYAKRAEAAGVTLLRGTGRFVGHKQIAVGNRGLTADKIVVATGSRPKDPSFADLPVWTSDNLFPFEGEPPRSLLVIGGGFIGTEMASFFAAMGTAVTLFSRGDKLLEREDSDIETVFQTEFVRSVPTHCRAQLHNLTHDGTRFSAEFSMPGGVRSFTAEHVLFAIGRVPNADQIGLEKTGLQTDARGFLPVDDHLETAVPGIYAAGDVNGRYMLQHAAAFEVQYLRQKFLRGLTDPIDKRHIAHAVFSHPEVASVGMTEDQLKASGTPHVAVLEDWSASARAMAMRIDYPRIKLLVSPKDFSILGCHLVGPESATLLHQVLAIMHLKNDVRELAEMIYIHPALNECFLPAAVQAVVKVRQAQRAG